MDERDFFEDEINILTHEEILEMCIEEGRYRHPDSAPFICFVESSPGDIVEVNFTRNDWRKVN
jgi:hypothetical protein